MSMSRTAGIVLPGYNPLKVPNAPTIGTATAGDTQVSVAFTAPSCVGGGAITSYTAYANCGVKTSTGASSPLVVTGLTNCTAYTFKVTAANAYGPSYPSAASNSATPQIVQGQQAYTTAGTYSWVAPTGVTSVSVVVVGAGGRGGQNADYAGGGGGGLAYANNYTVTPGNTYTVVVGANTTGAGGASYFISSGTLQGGGGGTGGYGPATGSGGTSTGTARTGGGTGGTGGAGGGATYGNGGGGGAGGYTGNGGNGGSNGVGVAGSGGGGGGGGGGVQAFCYPAGGGARGGGGGGVGILGSGSNGSGGSAGVNATGGSSGASASAGAGGSYGGASGGRTGTTPCSASVGAVRIIWPGTTRAFPSTNTGNL